MSAPTYILDANVFIEAARRYYAFDLAPRFWETLTEHATKGRIKSIDRVRHELEHGNDELKTWANGHFSHAFVSTDDDVVLSVYADIMNWVFTQEQFSDSAKAEFASGADGWLVAYAKVNGNVVVTHEVFNPDIRRKVPIPNVCQAFGVPFLNTFEMLRTLGVRWTR